LGGTGLLTLWPERAAVKVRPDRTPPVAPPPSGTRAGRCSATAPFRQACRAVGNAFYVILDGVLPAQIGMMALPGTQLAALLAPQPRLLFVLDRQ